MKKIFGVAVSLAMTFGVALSAAAPVYASVEPCPGGSLQGDTSLNNKYLSTDATDAEKATVTKPGSFAVQDASAGTTSGAIFSSIAQCNMNVNDLNATKLMDTVNTIANAILGVLGIVAVVVIILGGIQYATSAGDVVKLKKAKDTILYGIIGLMIALLAYAIVNFILSSVWG